MQQEGASSMHHPQADNMKTWNELLEGYCNDRLTPDELEAFLQEADAHQEEFAGAIHAMLVAGKMPQAGDEPLRERLWQQVLAKVRLADETGIPVRSIRWYRKTWFRVAAMVFFTGSLVAMIWLMNPTPSRKNATSGTSMAVQDAAPAHEGAILTLADGKSILLDSLPDGVIAVEGNTKVTIVNGQLAYEGSHAKNDEVSFNTMSTPKGRIYHLQLPDGTKAWLNAASSITYPTAFPGSERKVSITGEVYFEVASNARKPFLVSVGDRATVEVLGTHFNVNGYADEPVISTTLLEGSVRVMNGNNVVLKPGEMATISNAPTLSPLPIKIQNADPEAVMAWKNERFYFDNTDIPTIMRQLARWYDVEIVYEGAIPGGHFNGKPSRLLPASQMLTLIGYSGVNCRIEGKKIIVME